MNILARILISGIAVWIAALILPGVHLSGFLAAVAVGLLLAVVNIFIKPILVILTLPITLITLGLFVFVINALMVLLVQWIVPGFAVDGFWWAMLFSIVVTAIKFLIDQIFGVK